MCAFMSQPYGEVSKVEHLRALRDIEMRYATQINAVRSLMQVPIVLLADVCPLGAPLQKHSCMFGSDRTLLKNLQFGFLFVHVLPYGMSPTRGVRFGEATQPGPLQTITLAFLNPTTIWGKEVLIDQMPAQIWFAAETAANETVQKAMTTKLRSKDIRTVWSQPTLSRDEPLSEHESYRGKASGAAILSRLPCRPVRHTLTIPEEFATRITSAIIQVHSVQLHCISIYGFCLSQPKARQRTDKMLQLAARLVDDVALPTVIAGDFNHELTKLNSWMYFAERGYRSTAMLHQEFYECPMPSTYLQPTCNDQILVPPQLTRFVQKIEVRNEGEFAGHHPVLLTMQMPMHQLYKQVQRVPKPFHHFGIAKQDFAKHYSIYAPWKADDLAFQKQLDSGFTTWAERVESAMRSAIAEKHSQDPLQFPSKGLPNAYRGRCKEQTLKKQPWIRAEKQAWNGHYTPLQETISWRFAKFVKQLRRIQSLRARVETCIRIQQPYDQCRQMQAEWNAILKAPGFVGGFSTWIFNKPELCFVPEYVPNLEYLSLLEQFLLHQCKDLDFQEKRARKMTKRFDQWRDRKLGHRTKMFRMARKPSLPPVEMLQIEHQENVAVVQQFSGLIEVTMPVKQTLAIGQKVKVQGIAAEVINVTEETCELFVEDELPMHLQQLTLEHTQLIQQPQSMVDALHAYWAQYWNRDDPEDQFTPEVWQDFHTFLRNVPKIEQIAVPYLNMHAWQEAVSTMKSSSAPGVCGWVVDDLKSLPEAAIHDLAMLFWAHVERQSPLPQWLLQVRTVPLAKVSDQFQPSMIRPISIYATLYRWWARVLTHAILVSWSKTMPEALIGYVPQRNMEHAMWKMQYSIELQHEHELTPMGGLTLDIIKAFNALPRLPTEWCLVQCGVPSNLVQFWQANLRSFSRTWTVQGSVLLPTNAKPTTTGLPEGDTWSVLGMASMSLAWGLTLEALGSIRTSLFADNWTWRSVCPLKHRVAFQLTQEYMRVTRLAVDWKKSWAWATGDNHKQAWADLIAQEEFRIGSLKNHAKDLGFHLNYAKVLARETFEQRKADGISMLRKLKSEWFDLDDTAHLIKVAVYPKVFYGCSITAIGDNHLKDIRSAVAQAYLKGVGQPNPYLAAILPSQAAEDPEIYLLKLALRHARSVVIQMDDHDQQVFFRQVAAHPKEKNLVRGPAGALACYLVSIGVHMTITGMMHLSAFGEVHLLQSSWKDILAWLDYAWSLRLQSQLHTRKNWCSLPMIDFRQTAALFSKLPRKQRKHVLVDVTGANLTNNRKAKFDAEQTHKCQLCLKEEDTVQHRVLHCASTAHVRLDHSKLVEQLHEQEEVHVLLPVKYLHPFTEWNVWLQARFPSMMPCAQGLELLRAIQQKGCVPVLYTDGSCDHPTKPSNCTAAYAVVLSLEHLEDSQGQFHVMGVAECPGRQSIPRAELAAVIEAMKLSEASQIVTDCQSVVDLYHKCIQLSDVRLLHMHPNYDLVKQFWVLLQKGEYTIKKTQAHREISHAKNAMELLEIAGNAKADLAAKTANHRFRESRRIALDPLVEKQETEFLQNHWLLRYELLVEKAKAEIGAMDIHKPEVAHQGQTLAQIFSDWQVPEPNRKACFDLEKLLPKVRWSLWGTAYSRLLLRWLAMLWWPPEEVNCKNKRYGISWFELTFNFIAVTGLLPCINVGPSGAPLNIHQLSWDGRNHFHSSGQKFQKCAASCGSVSGRRTPATANQITS